MKNLLLLLFALFVINSLQAQNWQWMNPLTQGNGLYCIKLVTPTTGIAVGEFGAILKTTNSGSTWNVQPSGTSQGLFSVSFPNENTGYAVGRSGVILKPCGLFIIRLWNDHTMVVGEIIKE
ncbi:MAG: YCF48-related protein [Bacteroidota bacterium]